MTVIAGLLRDIRILSLERSSHPSSPSISSHLSQLQGLLGHSPNILVTSPTSPSPFPPLHGTSHSHATNQAGLPTLMIPTVPAYALHTPSSSPTPLTFQVHALESVEGSGHGHTVTRRNPASRWRQAMTTNAANVNVPARRMLLVAKGIPASALAWVWLVHTGTGGNEMDSAILFFLLYMRYRPVDQFCVQCAYLITRYRHQLYSKLVYSPAICNHPFIHLPSDYYKTHTRLHS